MEIQVSLAHIDAMYASMLTAGMLAMVGLPPDVMVYVKGESTASNAADHGARATVKWMFARIGVRLVWRDGELGTSPAPGGPVLIQVRFSVSEPKAASPNALAIAMPFGSGATAITVLYDRIRMAAGSSAREPYILAHVLAHEIGHVLQNTNWHSQTGVMKAHWNRQDYDAMGRKPLEFTSDDVDLITQGLQALKARKGEPVE